VTAPKRFSRLSPSSWKRRCGGSQISYDQIRETYQFDARCCNVTCVLDRFSIDKENALLNEHLKRTQNSLSFPADAHVMVILSVPNETDPT
jgi:hypothetical protein